MNPNIAAVVTAFLTLSAQGPQQPLYLSPSVAQLVVVDAFVADSRGRPVSRLTVDDFELRDDHRKVQIVAFESPHSRLPPKTLSERPEGVGPEATAPSAPDAEIMAVFIDRKLLSPGGQRRAVDQARALAQDHIEAGGRVVVVAEAPGLQPLTSVTSQMSEVYRALEQIKSWTVSSPGAGHELVVISLFEGILATQGCIRGLPQLLDVVRDYARWRALEAQEVRDRLGRLVDALVGLRGRKALVYVSEGLEQRPGIHLFEQITAICPEILQREYSQVFAAMQEIETSAILKEASARANAARVTFYPIDARGLMTATAMDISRPNRRYLPSAKNDFIRDANLVNPYQQLAEETGGFPMVRGLSPAVATKRLRAEAEGHYVLAFTPSRDPDGKAHDITVSLKKERRGVRIRHRMSYLHTEPAVQRGQRALSALIFGLEENTLRASLEIARVDPERALVKATVPLDALRFEETQTGRQATLRVVVALRSSATAKSIAPAVAREKEFTITLPAGAQATGTHGIVVDVPISESQHEFAVGIEDVGSGRATYLRRLLGAVVKPGATGADRS